MVRNGAPLIVVGQALGHSDTRIVEKHYALGAVLYGRHHQAVGTRHLVHLIEPKCAPFHSNRPFLRAKVLNLPRQNESSSPENQPAGGIVLKGIGAGSGLGLIVGLLLVWWVRPGNSGGTAMLIVGSLLVFSVGGSIASAIKKIFGKQE